MHNRGRSDVVGRETSDQTKVKRRKKRKRIDAAKLSFGDAEGMDNDEKKHKDRQCET